MYLLWSRFLGRYWYYKQLPDTISIEPQTYIMYHHHIYYEWGILFVYILHSEPWNMVLSKKKNVKLDDRYVSIRVDQTSSHRSGAETLNFAEMCPNPP